MHANFFSLRSVEEIDPGILGIMYPVLVPRFPFLYLKKKKHPTKQNRKYQENSLKAEGNTLTSGSPYCSFIVVNK